MRFRLGLSAILLASAACGGSSPTSYGGGGGGNPPLPSGSVSDVTIQDFSFSPSAVTIAVGTAVRWTNNGPSTHTSTSDTGVWGSGSIGPPGGGAYGGGAAGTYQRTFGTAGTYAYHCMFHPQMKATITVTP